MRKCVPFCNVIYVKYTKMRNLFADFKIMDKAFIP